MELTVSELVIPIWTTLSDLSLEPKSLNDIDLLHRSDGI